MPHWAPCTSLQSQGSESSLCALKSEGTGLKHFSEGSYSVGAARVLGIHAVPSVPVQEESQVGLGSSSCHFADGKLRPGGGRGVTSLGSTGPRRLLSPGPTLAQGPEKGSVCLWKWKLRESERGCLSPGIQFILQQVSALWVVFGQQFLLLVHTLKP